MQRLRELLDVPNVVLLSSGFDGVVTNVQGYVSFIRYLVDKGAVFSHMIWKSDTECYLFRSPSLLEALEKKNNNNLMSPEATQVKRVFESVILMGYNKQVVSNAQQANYDIT